MGMFIELIDLNGMASNIIGMAFCRKLFHKKNICNQSNFPTLIVEWQKQNPRCRSIGRHRQAEYNKLVMVLLKEQEQAIHICEIIMIMKLKNR